MYRRARGEGPADSKSATPLTGRSRLPQLVCRRGPRPGDSFAQADRPVGRTAPGPRIELPAYESAWESYHSVTTPGYGAIWPAPARCEALELSARDRELDLYDSSGVIASIFRASRANRAVDFKLVYLRQDLLQRYLVATKQRLAWAVWGERQFHYEHRPRGVEDVYRTYQHIHRRW